ncbi:unnamed protein product [Prorocentrum cordatum]|uniref:Uncharacterized protein n=1 Tax=Prorocentrum cordatum TaxID=2364126 RepID=A0ABN9TX80_9DINO|nr:unnamed protein product [Polarella glacialis]
MRRQMRRVEWAILGLLRLVCPAVSVSPARAGDGMAGSRPTTAGVLEGGQLYRAFVLRAPRVRDAGLLAQVGPPAKAGRPPSVPPQLRGSCRSAGILSSASCSCAMSGQMDGGSLEMAIATFSAECEVPCAAHAAPDARADEAEDLAHVQPLVDELRGFLESLQGTARAALQGDSAREALLDAASTAASAVDAAELLLAAPGARRRSPDGEIGMPLPAGAALLLEQLEGSCPWTQEIKEIFWTFATFAAVSNLRLNMTETIAIPLSDVDAVSMQTEMPKLVDAAAHLWCDQHILTVVTLTARRAEKQGAYLRAARVALVGDIDGPLSRSLAGNWAVQAVATYEANNAYTMFVASVFVRTICDRT